MGKIFVNNLTTRNIALGMPIKGPAPESEILFVGMNEVDEEAWNRATKGHKLVAALLDEEHLKVIALPKEGDKPVELPEMLSKLGAKDAIEAIKGVVDLSILEKWGKDDTRASVKQALDAQVAAIKKMDDKLAKA